MSFKKYSKEKAQRVQRYLYYSRRTTSTGSLHPHWFKRIGQLWDMTFFAYVSICLAYIFIYLAHMLVCSGEKEELQHVNEPTWHRICAQWGWLCSYCRKDQKRGDYTWYKRTYQNSWAYVIMTYRLLQVITTMAYTMTVTKQDVPDVLREKAQRLNPTSLRRRCLDSLWIKLYEC